MPPELILKELSRYKIGTFADIVYRHALLFSDKEAFIYEKERITFGEFNARVNSLIHALNSIGVKKGDVIGILAWNCLDYIYVIGAAMKGGFIVAPFNTRLQVESLDYLINYSEAGTIFVGPEFVEGIEGLRPRLPKIKHYISLEEKAPNMKFMGDLMAKGSREEPEVFVEEDDLLYLIFTSGTTGIPKGALYNHRRFMDDSRTVSLNLGAQPEHRHILITPLFHIAGLTHFRAFLYVGACSVIMKTFDAAATLQAIQDEKITHMDLVPTQVAAMLNLPDVGKYDLSSIKIIWYGGSPIPLEVLKRGMKILGPVFAEGYGQSESGPNISHLSVDEHNILDRPEEEQKILSSLGHPFLGVHVRVVDADDKDLPPGEVGEIIVQSNHNMLEYWNKPEETAKAMVNGWLHTGDMGYYDQRGYVYISDRKADMIISGGENIFPREVEEVIYRHPAVYEAAVIGVPDDYWVEKVHAVVSLRPGMSLSGQELMDFCKQNIARYKAPKSVDIVDVLPKNPAGKILKTELRKRYRESQKK
jgi:long-chain acyl-CoA synthetase